MDRAKYRVHVSLTLRLLAFGSEGLFDEHADRFGLRGDFLLTPTPIVHLRHPSFGVAELKRDHTIVSHRRIFTAEPLKGS